MLQNQMPDYGSINKTKGKTLKLSRCVLSAVQGICRSRTLSKFKLIYFEPYNRDLCLVLVVCLKGIDFSSAAKWNCFPYKFSLCVCYLIACWIFDVQFIESLPGPFDSLALQSIAPISWFSFLSLEQSKLRRNKNDLKIDI